MTFLSWLHASPRAKIYSSRVFRALMISLLALFLRGYLAAVGPIEYDEPVYVDAAIQYSIAIHHGNWSSIWLSTFNYEHPVFTKLIYGFTLVPFKPFSHGASMPYGKPLPKVPNYNKILTMRLISASAGSAAVFILSLINPLAGLALAIHSFAVKYTSVVYLDAIPLFASLFAFWSAQRAFPEIDRNGLVRKNWLVLSAVLIGMAAASKYMYGVIVLAIMAGVLLKPRRFNGKTLLWLAGWGALCVFFFVLFDPYLWVSPVTRLRDSLQWSVTYSNNDQAILDQHYPFWQPINWLLLDITHNTPNAAPFFRNAGDYFILADTQIFILAAIGIPMLVRKNRAMACWLVIGFVFLFLWKTKWPQYVLLVLPPICLSAAFGFEFLRDGYRWLIRRMNQPADPFK